MSTNWSCILLDPLDKIYPSLYTINFTKIRQKSFYIQIEQKVTLWFVKWAPKWKCSTLIDHSVVFSQICQKLPLYTKWAKIKTLNEHLINTRYGNLQMKSWSYNTNSNNMSENPFIKVHWIRYTFEVERDSL